jgi:fatty acid synthase
MSIGAKSSSQQQQSNCQHQTELLVTVPQASHTIHYQLHHLLPTEAIVEMNQVEGSRISPLFVVHPIEGSVYPLELVMSRVGAAKVYGLQCTVDTSLTSVEQLAETYIKRIEMIQPHGPYHLAGYSFGACVAIEMALQLQQRQAASGDSDSSSNSHDHVTSLTLLDGSHSFVAAYTGRTKERLSLGVDTARTETEAVCAFISQWALRLAQDKLVIANIDMHQLAADILSQSDFDSRVALAASTLVNAGVIGADSAHILHGAIMSFYRKLVIADSYKPTSRLGARTCVTLVRASDSIAHSNDLGSDYGLAAVCQGHVDVHVVDGSHETFVIEVSSANKVSALIDKQLLQRLV